MPDINSLYTTNGIPVANKTFEKVIFKHGLYVSPLDLIAFQDTIIRDFDNFLFATRGQINGVYKTEYDPVKDELTSGLDVTLQQSTVLSPTSNYELRIGRGKAYIGGKLVIVPLNDYVEVPDNDVYPDPITLHLILERVIIPYSPSALGEPGFAIDDGKRTSDREEAGYTLKLVDEVSTDLDASGNLLHLEIAKLFRPPILKAQSEIALNAKDGSDDEGQNWAKYDANLHILSVEKVTYLTYGGETLTKIPVAITQQQWDNLNDSNITTTLVQGAYYVPYTTSVLIVNSDIDLISQERIWFMPHTAGLQLTDTRYIIEDLPSVIGAAFQAVADLTEHKTNHFEEFIPDGLVDEFTDGTSDTFWTLPIAEDENFSVYLDDVLVSPSLYTVTDVVERTYEKDGEDVTEEWGRIAFTNPPAAGQRMTVDMFHDSHTLYVENAKHESHRGDIDAHPNYINNDEFAQHLLDLNDDPGDIESVVVHDNRYYTQTQLDDPSTGKSDKGHDHDLTYSVIGHLHQISAVSTLQDLLTKIEDNLGVYNKTTRLILEKITHGVDGVENTFNVDSLLLEDETAKLIGVRADLTSDSIRNPVILKLLNNPSSGTVTGLPDNFSIENSGASFPTDGSLIGGHINPNTDNDDVFEIISNTATTIVVAEDISSYTSIGRSYTVNDFTPGGVNPWTAPQKVSYGGQNLGLVVSAVQSDDEVWSVWIDTRDVGQTYTMWWATRVVGDSVWSPPVNSYFSADSDSRPSIVKFPNGPNEDLMILYANNHNVYYSYVSHGQTYLGDPVLFYDLPGYIYDPQGIFVHDQGGGGDKIWLVYRREEAGIQNIYLRVFGSSSPFSPEGSEILLSSGTENCYFPTFSQELSDGGNIWVAWISDNSVYDNKKKPKMAMLAPDTSVVVAPSFIPSDISQIVDNFNNDSKLELHHSSDGLVWLVYSVLEGGSFNIYYTHLDYELASNSFVNLTPPVELARGHEVSITERSDQTIWINYNQSTQVYSQVRTIGSGEVKWTRVTQELEFEVAPVINSFMELRWQLPFSDIEGRLEAVESEIRSHSQIILMYLEGDAVYVDDNTWTMPAEYIEDKASGIRIYRDGLRLKMTDDWTLSGDTITFTATTGSGSVVIVEWNQVR